MIHFLVASATFCCYMAMALGGTLLLAAVLGAACLLTWCLGATLWHRMRRIYRLTTIWHYLEQLEKTGRYHFPPPDKDNP
jgi:hypothetical protein